MIRAFIAVELPDDVRAAIGEVQDRLKRAHTGVKVSWTKIENIHLTLQFLGYVPEDKVAGISATLDKVAGNHARFAVPVGGVGAFPNLKVPRVLWVGCDDREEKLRALAMAVRACGWADAALTRALDSLKDTVCGTLAVAAVHLFQSQLHPQGSVYSKLSSHQLM